MNVLLKKVHFLNGVPLEPGKVYNLPDSTAEALVKAGHAQPHEPNPAGVPVEKSQSLPAMAKK